MAGHDPYRPHPRRHVAPELSLPVARLRRLGVEAPGIIGLAQRWGQMSTAERAAQARQIAEMSDEELLAAVGGVVAGPEPDDAAESGPPDGTAVDVLAWVQAQPDQREAARRALEAERARDPRPRSTLIANLEKLA